MANNNLALVVEDDALNLKALTSLLNRMQISYKRNTTGSEVIEQVQQWRPNFILLDMDLPEGDPFAICEEINADPALSHIPVIAIGDATVTPKLQSRIRASQFAGYILKPICQQDLDNMLQNVLGAKLA